MPCLEWFDEQDAAYREHGAPAAVQGPGLGRGRHRAWAGATSSATPAASSRIEHFGASADYNDALPRVRLHRRGRRRPPGRRATSMPPSTTPAEPAGPHRRDPSADPTRPRPGRSTHDRPPARPSPTPGVSIWLDDLSRERLETGNLAELIDDQPRRRRHHQPVDLRRPRWPTGDALRRAGRASSPPPAPTSTRPSSRLTTDDVRDACDVLRPVVRRHRRRRTAGCRSRSTRGWPTTPTDRRRGQGAVDGGRPAQRADQDPGDRRGPARPSPRCRRGHQRQRHADLLPRPLPRGHGRLPRRARAGPARPATTCPTIHSVASFFVSRVDTEIDKRLDAIGTDEAMALRGKAGVANARLAYQAYEEVFAGDALAARSRPTAPTRSARCGPRPASRTRTTPTPCTSPTSSSPDTVNTMPEKTLDAVADHGEVAGDTVTGRLRRGRRGARQPRARSASTTTTSSRVLEHEGVEKFEKSWDELLDDGHAASSRSGRRQ